MRKLTVFLMLTLITIFACNDEVEYKLSEDACSVFDQNSYQSLDSLSRFIPNIITPNGDNINDAFNIFYLDSFPNNSVTIYDRNNNQIAHFSPYNNDWTGGTTYRNGLYYIKITIDSVSAVGSFLSLGDDDDYYDINLSDCNCNGGANPVDCCDPLLK